MASNGRTGGQIKRAINKRIAEGRGTAEFRKAGLDWDFLDALGMRGEVGTVLIGDVDVQVVLKGAIS